MHAELASSAVHILGGDGGACTNGGVGGLHKIDEVHRVPTIRVIRGVHTVCGDGGVHRDGGDRGVCTAVGKAEETHFVVLLVRTNNKNPLKGIN